MNSKMIGSGVLMALLIVSMIGYMGVFGGGSGEGKMDYTLYAKDEIMSGVYKVYGNPDLDLWVAKVVIHNSGNGPMTNIKVKYSIDNYAPEVERDYPLLVPNGTIVDLYYPILSSDVTKLSSATPSNLRVRITYDSNGKSQEESTTKPIKILGRNDFVFSSLSPEESTGSFYDTFSNAQFLAAWVTPSDPVVREFADMGNKLAGGAGASLSDEGAIKSLSGMWKLAVLNGFSYKTEASDYWTGKFAEHIMYPRDVIRDKSGTCVDLALWFASLAMSQGLKAYIVLIPGHAFPLIQLPSGTMLPVETTMINDRVSFQKAVQVGMDKSWKMAMSGPHTIIDVAGMQSQGIVPPELPQLPADVLGKWGISLQGAGANTGGNGGTGGNNGGGAQTQWNTYNGEYFSFQYPADWGSPKDQSGYVYLTSPNSEFEFMVIYAKGADLKDMVATFEGSLVNTGIKISARQEARGNIAGMSVYTVLYSLSTSYGDYSAVARYFTAGGTGYAVIYDFPKNDQDYNQLGEHIVSTFRLR
ncbi:cysteine protease [Thermococcus sp.]|uniref:cysteine protease n=1 Tax=Thermococcus sp. TaxID=35749 RepID=UPI0025DE1B66|nr:cysteine protease [Thermococcus sp.]